ncbi:hypothetical protein CSUB01_12081 [Colletotrichum sublineola]|uniref:CCHC-type domain-containing protein n=1 Tax=Colletotrichum sublineola TaxID=1173701 RepID=A0A066XJG5_COLSU|nr:hypothetical protein CSUB01_12081 [Colletotrichum sublineola]
MDSNDGIHPESSPTLRRRAASVDELQLSAVEYLRRNAEDQPPSTIGPKLRDDREETRGRTLSRERSPASLRPIDEADEAFIAERSRSRLSASTRRSAGAATPGSEPMDPMRAMMSYFQETMRAMVEEHREERRYHERLLRELADRPAQRLSKKEYEKPPVYNCRTIGEESTSAQVADWIVAIEAANRLRPGSTVEQQVEWALSKVSPTLQTQWRNHERGLTEPLKWEDFLAFVRRQHVDPEAQERDYRRELRRKRMGDGQTPSQYLAEWLAIHHNLGTEGVEESKAEAYQYFFGLPASLQDEMIRQKTPILRPRDVAHEADRLWSLRDRRGVGDNSRKDSKKRPLPTNDQPWRPAPFQRDQRKETPKDFKSQESYRRPFGGDRRGGQSPKDRPDGIRCYTCFQKGHMSIACPKKKAGGASDSRPFGRRSDQKAATVQQVGIHPRVTELDSSGNE